MTDNHELAHVDLCSGIGGFALAARWAGFHTVAFAEVDQFCAAVLRKHWPEVPNYGDIWTANFSTFAGRVGLLTAGYPCQGESVAGLRRGKEDDRWLWPAVSKTIKTIRPTWFIGENVAGHVTLGLDDVLSDLEAEGYSTQAFVIPACAVGAWHRRERVWIVGHARSVQRQPAPRRGRVAVEGKILGQARRPQGADALGRASQNVAYSPSVGRSKGRKRSKQQGLEPIASGQDVADPARERCGEAGQHSGRPPQRITSCGKILADAQGNVARGLPIRTGETQPGSGVNGEADANANVARSQGRDERGECASEWTAWTGSQPLEGIWKLEPRVGRVAHGVSGRVGQLKGYGNAIVPQDAFEIIHPIAQIQRGETCLT